MRTALGLMVSCFIATSAWAGGDECAQAAKKESCSATCSAGGCSDKAFAAAGVPKMRAVVADKEFNCPLEAAEAAKKANVQPVFYVADVKYTDMAEAGKAYAKQLNGYLADVTAVKYAVAGECTSCPMTAEALAKKAGKPVKYRLASFEFDNKAEAEKAATKAREAIEAIKVEMKVDGKTYTCCDEAGKAAKQCGKSVEYNVAGQSCGCPIQADVVQAMTKIRIALGAIEKTHG